MYRSSLLILALTLSACWHPTPPDGALACNLSGKACPDDYSCISGTCWRNGHEPDMATPSTCFDANKDGDESDVDCGGSCARCDAGKTCGQNADCASSFCNATTGLCVQSSCEDGIKDGTETDVDCGGDGQCPRCVVGKGCLGGSDCASSNCDGSHLCVSLQCQDGVKNGSETDVDCGGTVCAACADGRSCMAGSDCSSTFCAVTSHVCVASRCENQMRDGSETDVDCGGSCHGCAVNMHCSVASDCATSSCVSSWCALVSGPPNWLPVASMPTARSGFGIATASDSRIYVIAGDTNTASDTSGYTTVVESFAPNAWGAGAAFPSATVSSCAMTGADGKIYAVGGLVPAGMSSTPTANVYVFAPAGGWTAGSSLPAPLANMACAVDDKGRLFAFGGQTTGGPTNEVLVFASGSWSSLGAWALPANQSYPSGARGPDGRMYLTGGFVYPSSNPYPSTTYVYNPSTNTWTRAHDMKTGRYLHASVSAPDGRLYVVGGSGMGSPTLASCEAYSPATDSWVDCANLTARYNFGAAIGVDGRIYAAGGTTTGGVTGVVEAYGPVVSVSPSGATRGATATVTGSNFAASANVTVHFGDVKAAAIASGTSDASGNLSAPIAFAVPNVLPATYRIYVVDDRSQFPVSAAFTVTP